MSDDTGTMAAYLAKHPRMAGALFTILLVLTQVGAAAANKNSTIG